MGTVLNEIADKGHVLTIQPGGNHGDELIYRGFERIRENENLDTIPFDEGRNRLDAPPPLSVTSPLQSLRWARKQATYLRHRFTTSPSVVYIHGGGNFNDLWRSGVDCYRHAARYFDCPIVIGPQSCRFETIDPATIFSDTDQETHLFCREEYSYDIMEDAASDHDHVSLYLADDTALSLTKDDLPVTDYSSEYTLVAMRTDAESASPLLQDDLTAPIQVSDISITMDAFEDFVNAVARAKEVHTDRLHVAILATLLGKRVVWYEVGYHKSRGVYEYSLSDEKNITFVYKN
ncbi:polysaccharide pyruvyl transferase family protein [Salinigranum sp. GCM10025319]|uniref:polysaccharide pyruvyl transferase family protein n=1 Tax=Salinigranum sp. GCM10025319 TaxID=3252687 RepID=UPI003611BB3C